MLHTPQDEQAARAYVRGNGELRDTLGIVDPDAFELEYLGAGEHNFNYTLTVDRAPKSRRYVLRVNVVPQVFHKDQVSYEFSALKAVEPSGRTPRALYLDHCASALRDGVLVMAFCEGEELDFDHLRAGDLRCAAQLMANIHATPVDADCPLHRPHDPFDDLWAECMERFSAYRASGAEDPRITKWVDLFCKATRTAMDNAGSPSKRAHIVHTETLPSHFLIPAASARAAAANGKASGVFCDDPGSIIDWERAIVAEPAQDVAYFTGPTMTYWDSEYLFPARDVEAFVENYWRAVDGRFERGNFDTRFNAYRMLTTLRSVGWCCKRLGLYGSIDAVRSNDKVSRKLPVYLSDDFNEMLAEDVFGL